MGSIPFIHIPPLISTVHSTYASIIAKKVDELKKNAQNW